MAQGLIEPIEQLIERDIECNCHRTHKTKLKKLVVEMNAIDNLPELLQEYMSYKMLLVADRNTKLALGDRVLSILGEYGYNLRMYVFEEDITPNEADIGKMLIEVSADVDVLVAIGSAALTDLLKYICLITRLPLVSIPTAASSDRYAMPYSFFFDDKKKQIKSSTVPDIIVVDLEVIAAAPKHMAPAGAAAVLAKQIALFDWKLSNIIDETVYCDDLAQAMLYHIYNFTDSLSGSRPLYSIKTLEYLMKALIFSGILVSFCESMQPAFGSETLMSDTILMTGSYSKEVYSEQYIKAVTTANCARIADSIIASGSLDFAGAKYLLNDYGWVMHNNEINRVFKEDANAVLSQSGGFSRYNEQTHMRRLFAITDRWKEIIEAASDMIPEYTILQEMLRNCVLPYRFEDLGMTRDQALDAVLWSSELSNKYNLLTLIWELGEIDSVAYALTSRMK